LQTILHIFCQHFRKIGLQVAEEIELDYFCSQHRNAIISGMQLKRKTQFYGIATAEHNDLYLSVKSGLAFYQ